MLLFEIQVFLYWASLWIEMKNSILPSEIVGLLLHNLETE